MGKCDTGEEGEVEFILNGIQRGIQSNRVDSDDEKDPEPVKPKKAQWQSVLDAPAYARINQPLSQIAVVRQNRAEQQARGSAKQGMKEAFNLELNQLFYINTHYAIKNSADVNVYRTGVLFPHLRRETRLYDLPTNEPLLKFINRPDYHAAILNALQFHAASYPNGCDAEELEHFERQLQHPNAPFKLGVDTAISSMAECVRRGLIVKEGPPTRPMFKVNEAIRSVELWRLPPGLPSNLFRVLRSFGDQKLTELVSRMDICLDENGDFLDEPAVLADFIRLANNFPTIFQLTSHDKQVYSVEVLATMRIDKECPAWKVLLDCPNYSDNIFYCDCKACCSFLPVVYAYS